MIREVNTEKSGQMRRCEKVRGASTKALALTCRRSGEEKAAKWETEVEPQNVPWREK